MHNRHLKQILVGCFQRKYSRLVALTGARQVGKTTLVREAFSEIPYISVEELWPLTLPEIGTTSWEEPVRESRLIELLKDGARRT